MIPRDGVDQRTTDPYAHCRKTFANTTLGPYGAGESRLSPYSNVLLGLCKQCWTGAVLHHGARGHRASERHT
jgi:hypothetical protein